MSEYKVETESGFRSILTVYKIKSSGKRKWIYELTVLQRDDRNTRSVVVRVTPKVSYKTNKAGFRDIKGSLDNIDKLFFHAKIAMMDLGLACEDILSTDFRVSLEEQRYGSIGFVNLPDKAEECSD